MMRNPSPFSFTTKVLCIRSNTNTHKHTCASEHTERKRNLKLCFSLHNCAAGEAPLQCYWTIGAQALGGRGGLASADKTNPDEMSGGDGGAALLWWKEPSQSRGESGTVSH